VIGLETIFINQTSQLKTVETLHNVIDEWAENYNGDLDILDEVIATISMDDREKIPL
jgi:hypothetical protein